MVKFTAEGVVVNDVLDFSCDCKTSLERAPICGGAKGPCTLRLGSWNVTVPAAMPGPLRVSLAEV